MTSSVMGSPFDYPLSSRIDENDAVFILDKVLVPWENVFCYGDADKANNFFPQTGFLPRALLHGCTRLAVKLDFIAGLLLKAVEATGSKDFRGVQANVGEVLVWRNLFWGLTEAMVRNPKPWIGDYLLPDIEPAGAYQITSTMAYTKVKYLIEQTVASGLIFLNSSARDFKNPTIRPYLDKYMRGSNGYAAVDRVKLLKLLWDAMGTEFGGRHELYEINYGGSTEEIRRYVLFGAQALGTADRLKDFVEECLSEYDLDGWTVPDLTNPGDLSYHGLNGAQPDRPARKPSPAVVPVASGGEPRSNGANTAGRSYPGGFRNPFASDPQR
jgi:4-hydroxyphenylacetate 3-monooxygenase